MRGRLAVLAVVALTLGTPTLTGCDPTGPPADGHIQVVASTDVWGSVAAAVGGNDVDVTSIVHDPAQDPHDYQTTPSDAEKISTAQVAIYNGDGYDDFFATDLSATTSAHRVTVVAFDLSGRPATPDSNEHIFYDLPTVAKVADTLAARFGTIQPAHAAEFTRNAAAFDRGITGLLATVRSIGARHPGRRVVVTEPVADYLLHAAGITDVTPPAFEHAVESDTDIPVAAINAMIDLITGGQVAALINNAQTVTNITTDLATKADAAHVPVVNVTETLAQGSTGYLNWMTAQVSALATAMSASVH